VVLRSFALAVQSRPLFRFIIAGGTGTILGYGVFRLALAACGDRVGAAGLAQAGAYVIGVAYSYTINRTWTFRSDADHRRTLPRFITAHAGGLVLSSVLMEAGVAHLGMPPLACFVLISGGMAIVNFFVQHVWVFPNRISDAHVSPAHLPLSAE
jgi:putative flippase GtrA